MTIRCVAVPVSLLDDLIRKAENSLVNLRDDPEYDETDLYYSCVEHRYEWELSVYETMRNMYKEIDCDPFNEHYLKSIENDQEYIF